MGENGRGKEEEEARIVHRARDVSPRSRDHRHPPFYFYFSGQIYRSFTHSCSGRTRGSLGRNWRVSSCFSSLVLLFFALFLYNSRFLSSSVLVFSWWPRLYIYIYIFVCVWGITRDRYKNVRRRNEHGRIKLLRDIFKFENIQFFPPFFLPNEEFFFLPFRKTRNKFILLSNPLGISIPPSLH